MCDDGDNALNFKPVFTKPLGPPSKPRSKPNSQSRKEALLLSISGSEDAENNPNANNYAAASLLRESITGAKAAPPLPDYIKKFDFEEKVALKKQQIKERRAAEKAAAAKAAADKVLTKPADSPTGGPMQGANETSLSSAAFEPTAENAGSAIIDLAPVSKCVAASVSKAPQVVIASTETLDATAKNELDHLAPQQNLSKSIDCQEAPMASGVDSLEKARMQIAGTSIDSEDDAVVEKAKAAIAKEAEEAAAIAQAAKEAEEAAAIAQAAKEAEEAAAIAQAAKEAEEAAAIAQAAKEAEEASVVADVLSASSTSLSQLDSANIVSSDESVSSTALQFSQTQVDDLIAKAVAEARAEAMAEAAAEKQAIETSMTEAMAKVKAEAQSAIESSQTGALELLEGEISSWQAASAKELNDKNQQLLVNSKRTFVG